MIVRIEAHQDLFPCRFLNSEIIPSVRRGILGQKPYPLALPVRVKGFRPKPYEHRLPARVYIYLVGIFSLISDLFQIYLMVPNGNVLVALFAADSVLVKSAQSVWYACRKE